MLCWMCKLELSHLAVPFTRCRLGAWFCTNVERVPGIVLFANYAPFLPVSRFLVNSLPRCFRNAQQDSVRDCGYGERMPYEHWERLYPSVWEDYRFQGFYSLMYQVQNNCQEFIDPEILVRAKVGISILRKLEQISFKFELFKNFMACKLCVEIFKDCKNQSKSSIKVYWG